MSGLTEDKWSLAQAVLAQGGLTAIVDARDRDSLRGFFAAKGIDAEVVALDTATYRGKGAALRAACEATKGEYVFVLGPGQAASAALLPRYLEEMTVKCADIVIGSKRHPESAVAYPWCRRMLSRLYFWAVRCFLDVKVTDTEAGVTLYRRETLRYALERMLAKSAAFELEILAIAAEKGARIFEAPVGSGKDSASPVVAAKDRSTGADVGAGSAENGVDVGARSAGDAESFPLRIPRRFAWNKIKDSLAVYYRLKRLHYYAKCLVPKKLDHDPFVSVVIACPGGSWMLDECLAALAKQTYRNFEVIVLPDEELKCEVEVEERSVRFIATGKVRPAEKRNLGIREAKGEIIAFIDDDAYPDPHWLEYAVKYFGEPSIGAVGGPGVTPPGDRSLAKIGGRVYDNVLVSGNYRYRYKAGGVRMDVEDYPSCNLFVRKDLMEKFGGYRTDFWPGEDTLLCKDILDNWKRIVYDPWVVVYHHRRALFAAHLRQLGRYGFHRGYFCKRFPSNSLRLSYFVPTAFVVYVLSFALLPLAVPYLQNRWVMWGTGAYLLPLAFYLVLLLVTTVAVNPVTWLLTAAGVVASHFWYGVQFFRGICAKKAPCEYIGADHVGAVKSEK